MHRIKLALIRSGLTEVVFNPDAINAASAFDLRPELIECFCPILRAADAQVFRIDQIHPAVVLLIPFLYRIAAHFLALTSMLTTAGRLR